MTIPELVEVLKASAPALAGLASLIHPAAAMVRRRRRDGQLRQLVRQEVGAAVAPLGARVQQLEVAMAAIPAGGPVARPTPAPPPNGHLVP